MSLPFEMEPEIAQKQQEEVKEKLKFEPRKRTSAHRGRMALPAHLEVKEIEIYPEEDYNGMVCIGKDVTEELEYEPAKLYIKRCIRYKYAPKIKKGSSSGNFLPGLLKKVSREQDFWPGY